MNTTQKSNEETSEEATNWSVFILLNKFQALPISQQVLLASFLGFFITVTFGVVGVLLHSAVGFVLIAIAVVSGCLTFFGVCEYFSRVDRENRGSRY